MAMAYRGTGRPLSLSFSLSLMHAYSLLSPIHPSHTCATQPSNYKVPFNHAQLSFQVLLFSSAYLIGTPWHFCPSAGTGGTGGSAVRTRSPSARRTCLGAPGASVCIARSTWQSLSRRDRRGLRWTPSRPPTRPASNRGTRTLQHTVVVAVAAAAVRLVIDAAFASVAASRNRGGKSAGCLCRSSLKTEPREWCRWTHLSWRAANRNKNYFKAIL